MKFNLESYDDLGKCTFAPKHYYDTATDHIYECEFNEETKEIIRNEIEIDSLETLFKYLWGSPWCVTSDKNGTHYMYGKDPKPWWYLPRELGWKKFCEERLPEVKAKILEDNK